MKIIHLQPTVSEVQISHLEIDMILFVLRVIVEKIPLWEFQTIIGYCAEEVKSLIEKIYSVDRTNSLTEVQDFSLSIDELIIINNAFNQFGYEDPNKSAEKELFQKARELIAQMENRGIEYH